MVSAVLINSSATVRAADELDKHDSGYPEVNNGLFNIISATADLFELKGDWLPDFAFYEDETPNSEARLPVLNNGILLSRPKVLIGRNLVKEILRQTNGAFGIALSGIFAHEFAHVYQMMSGERGRLLEADANQSSRLIECHADFLAGWALPQYYWVTKTADLALAAEQFYQLGDNIIKFKDHHGTSIQRRSVMACGYTWGLIGPRDTKKASAQAWDVFQDLFPDWFVKKQ